MLNFILGTISLLFSVLLIPVPKEIDCWAATALFAPLVLQQEKYSSFSSLWRNSPISNFGLLYMASPHLSIHCFSLPVSYAQYFLRNLLYRLIPSSFRFAYKSFSRTTLPNIFLYCTYVHYVQPTVAILT